MDTLDCNISVIGFKGTTKGIFDNQDASLLFSHHPCVFLLLLLDGILHWYKQKYQQMVLLAQFKTVASLPGFGHLVANNSFRLIVRSYLKCWRRKKTDRQ